MMKILHIVGNRPQFIKLAPLYHELQKRDYEQCIIHTGQHYDESLSDIFFKELDIPKPYINLQVGGGSHAEMTAKALVALERTLAKLMPKLVVLYGDTNSTLAGALAASKLNLPIAHVEGGIRTNHKENPEEFNRIVTDHLSNILFCSDNASVINAGQEGMGSIAFCTGDIMYDAFLSIENKIEKAYKEDIVLMTWHRQENTSSRERMQSILYFIKNLKKKIICPMHPRTRKCLKEYGLWEEAQSIGNLEIIEPVGYLQMVSMMKCARLIVTDSGGLSKESSFAGAKCLFFSDLDIWDDLLNDRWIIKVNPEDNDSVKEALNFAKVAKRVGETDRPKYYGDGNTANIIVSLLEKYLFI